MNAKKFILEKYPVTVNEFKRGICISLEDISFICEKYASYKIEEEKKRNNKFYKR